MRILFDQAVPLPLKDSLDRAEISTAYEMGWSTLGNGTLIDSAEESGFEVHITTDKNLRYQQDLSSRQITIVVLPTTAWPKLKDISSEIKQLVNEATPGSYISNLYRDD